MTHRILIVGDSPFLDTGFSLLVRDISRALLDAGHTVANVGLWDTRPDAALTTWGKYTIPWKVYPGKAAPSWKSFSLNKYPDIIKDFNPTLVILITDIWIAECFMCTAVPTIYYFHVEGAPLPNTMRMGQSGYFKWPEILLRSEVVVFGGPFGKETTLKRLLPYIEKENLTGRYDVEKIKNWPVIPDGIDLETFKPLENKQSLKKSMLKLPEDSFVIGYFSRMNARKGLPYALEAFAQWPDRPENAYFYCHCAIDDHDGWNLLQMIEDLGIEKKVVLNKTLGVGEGVDAEQLNRYYNACDLVCSPSLGEGFGQTTCVMPGAQVKTRAGYINIEYVREGDEIATHEGRYQKVLTVYKSFYKGNMVQITPETSLPFGVTGPHRVLAEKKDKVSCNFGYMASELRKGDLLKYPVIREDDDQQIKEVLASRKTHFSQDKSLIFKYRDILLSFRKPLYNIISKFNKGWRLRLFDTVCSFKDVHHSGVSGRIRYILTPIKRRRRVPYKGYIYNFRVDVDHSFLVNGVTAVHNCQSLAAGVPVIITDYSELQSFDKGTLKCPPIAFYVETQTNIRRAIPAVKDIVKCYQAVYNREVDHLAAEARTGVMKFDWQNIKQRWVDLVATIPVKTLAEHTGVIPNLDKWIYYKDEGKKTVSVIICTKEKLDLISQCVASITRCTPQPFEVLVHDTGSTSSEVDAYLQSIARYKNFKVFRSTAKGFNFSIANNVVVPHATGEILVFLNNDTIVFPNWIEELTAVLRDDRVGIAGPKLLFPNNSIQHAGVIVGNRGICDHIYIGQPPTYPPANITREVSAVTGACFAIRKNVFEALGRFDEKYIIEFQDIDLCMRARQAGYKVVYVPQSVAYHVCSATRGAPRMKEALNDRGLFIERYYDQLTHADPFSPLEFANPHNLPVIEQWKIKRKEP